MSNKKTQQNNNRFADAIIWLFVILTLVLLIGISFFLYDFYSSEFPEPPNTQEHFGALGDYFGGILNPILSFITVCFLIFSIFLQRKELILTRKELALSAEELSKSNEISLRSIENQSKSFNSEVTRTEIGNFYTRIKLFWDSEIEVFHNGEIRHSPIKDVRLKEFEYFQNIEEGRRDRFKTSCKVLLNIIEDLQNLCSFIRGESIADIHFNAGLRDFKQELDKIETIFRIIYETDGNPGVSQSMRFSRKIIDKSVVLRETFKKIRKG